VVPACQAAALLFRLSTACVMQTIRSPLGEPE
jgi:hypothetical protein